jgi:endonuclease-8
LTLGPDLLSPDFDATEAARRLSERSHLEIGDALLDQEAMAGIGNIWKSETLYACRVNPFTRVGDIKSDRIDKVIATARARLLASANDVPYRGSRLQVYGRAGEPCRLCGSPIASRKQGPHARSTYWCPKCQA